MNEEEKKAMEGFKERLEEFLTDDTEKIIFYKPALEEMKIILNLIEKLQKECIFREDGAEEGLWHCSNCHDEWLFYEGTPEDNELKYCPHCGAKVIKYESYIEGQIEIANKIEEDYLKERKLENGN